MEPTLLNIWALSLGLTVGAGVLAGVVSAAFDLAAHKPKAVTLDNIRFIALLSVPPGMAAGVVATLVCGAFP